MNKYTKYMTQGAVIAAIYVVITWIFGFMGYGPIQFRISEALTVLPYFTLSAIPGLFIGCLISNVLIGSHQLDIILGSLATLMAAFLSYKMPKRALVPLPPVIVNAIVVPIILNITMNAPIPITIVTVGLGQILACYGIGYPLMLVLEKYKQKIF
ncbi:MAG: QueT transporter family protein [Epulopiscium sp.]|jgi:uncharacterized membrane protein|nr:QueT transporter family protein [Candidatus Epulonipiscium sp.]